MFPASSGTGYSPNDGLGGIYSEDLSSAGPNRQALGLNDALRCALFTGPGLGLLGVFLLCLAVTDPERAAVKTYNSAVSSWVATGGGLAQFQAALPSGLQLQLVPPVGGARAAQPGTSDGSVYLPLAASSEYDSGFLNVTRKVAEYPDYQLAYVATAPTFYSAFPFTGLASTVLAQVPNAPDFGASTPLLLVSCSNTQGLQYGVNCSGFSPPAPAPTAATELFVLERRRHRRRLMQSDTALDSAGLFGGNAPAQGASQMGASAGVTSRGGNSGRATTCRSYYRTITVLSSITLVANAPGIPDTATGYANPNWTITIAPCGAVRTSVNLPVTPQQWRADVRGLSPGASPAWCGQWPQLFSPIWVLNTASTGLSVTLRSAADPLLTAQSLTKCTGVLGVAPSSYAKRGTLLFVTGSALTLAGLLGMHRIAKAEGHALGVAAPLASLKAAWHGYGATESGVSRATVVGTPAGFTGMVSGAPTTSSARRRPAPSIAVPPAPMHAARFDGVTAPPDA